MLSAEKKGVGFDLKTVQAGEDVFLSLAVVSTTTQIGVFDLASSDVILLESGLRKIVESEQIVKVSVIHIEARDSDLISRNEHLKINHLYQVMHDGRRVSSILAHRYAIHLRSVFDTQVGTSSISKISFILLGKGPNKLHHNSFSHHSIHFFSGCSCHSPTR